VVPAAAAAELWVPIKALDVPNPTVTAVAAFLSQPKTSLRLPVEGGDGGVVANNRTVASPGKCAAAAALSRRRCDEDTAGAKHRVVVGNNNSSSSACAIIVHHTMAVVDFVFILVEKTMASNATQWKRKEISPTGRRCGAHAELVERADEMTYLVSQKVSVELHASTLVEKFSAPVAAKDFRVDCGGLCATAGESSARDPLSRDSGYGATVT
jgi:hypothetical protein